LIELQGKFNSTNNIIMDIKQPEYSYMFGLLQTDGHLYNNTRDRGKMSIQLSYKDRDILEFLSDIIPYHTNINDKIRSSNFKDNYETSTLSIYNKEFRDKINNWGIPYGVKSYIVKEPEVEYSKVDYYRGIIDGNGSLGMTRNNIPFVSLIIMSEVFADQYIKFLHEIIGKVKTTSRNKRDGAYNIAVYKEDAQKLIRTLYYPKCVALERKYLNAISVLGWERPKNMKIRNNVKHWNYEEDVYILSHSVKDSIEYLERTKKSIETRLWRLNKEDKNVRN